MTDELPVPRLGKRVENEIAQLVENAASDMRSAKEVEDDGTALVEGFIERILGR